MTKKSVLTFLCFIILILMTGACRVSKPETAYLNFEDGEIGWSTKFPESWEIVPDAEASSTEIRGGKKLEATANQKVEMIHTRLLWIRNGAKNSFISNKMNFNFPTATAYNENMMKINDVLIRTQKLQGVKFDYQFSTMTIDGLEFKTFEMTIYANEAGRILGHQLICTRYINGKTGLLLNINYTNDKDKQALMGVLRDSKFAIRN